MRVRKKSYIPATGPVVGLRNIVISFAVACEINHFVLDISITTFVQAPYVVRKSLPLRLPAVRVERCIRVIGACDKAKFSFGL